MTKNRFSKTGPSYLDGVNMQRIIGPYGAQHHYSYVTVLSRCGRPDGGGKHEPDCCFGKSKVGGAIEVPTTYASEC